MISVALPTLHAISYVTLEKDSLPALLALLAIDGGELRALKSLLKQKLERRPHRLLMLTGLAVISTLIVGAISGDIPKAMAWPLLYQVSNSLYSFLRTRSKSFSDHLHVNVSDSDVLSAMGLGAITSTLFSAAFKLNAEVFDSSLVKTALVAKQSHLLYETQSSAAKHPSICRRIAGIATSIGVAAVTDSVINAIFTGESVWTSYLATGVACCVGAAYAGKWVRNWIFGK